MKTVEQINLLANEHLKLKKSGHLYTKRDKKIIFKMG